MMKSIFKNKKSLLIFGFFCLLAILSVLLTYATTQGPADHNGYNERHEQELVNVAVLTQYVVGINQTVIYTSTLRSPSQAVFLGDDPIQLHDDFKGAIEQFFKKAVKTINSTNLCKE